MTHSIDHMSKNTRGQSFELPRNVIGLRNYSLNWFKSKPILYETKKDCFNKKKLRKIVHKFNDRKNVNQTTCSLDFFFFFFGIGRLSCRISNNNKGLPSLK